MTRQVDKTSQQGKLTRQVYKTRQVVGQVFYLAVCKNVEEARRDECRKYDCGERLVLIKDLITHPASSAQRVGFFNIGAGRVLDKIPGIGSGSGWVGVSKYAIGYFRVSLLLSGIFGYFGYFGYFRVFLGIFWVFRVCWVIP